MARKINVKLILQLKDAGLSRASIASTRHISRNSVSDVFQIAEEKHIRFSDVQDLPDEEVYRLFYPDKYSNETMYGEPDYEKIHEELKKVGVTLTLLHEEYVEQCQKEHKIPMGKTKFNDGYAQYTIQNKLTNHLLHKPGEAVEVDWSGPTMHYTDGRTGDRVTVYLFVATLPYSQYSYVEPCLDMKMNTFINCHVHMYEFFGGVPTRTICDNLKTGVTAHPKEGEIILTKDYSALGEHYVTAIMPAGVRKPKQKPSVEGTVGKIATAIIARCRYEHFESFDQLRLSVAKHLKAFNDASFQKREGSRTLVWEEEKHYLRSLPAFPYEVCEWVYGRKVSLDFHVIYKKNRYSCPYQYSGKEVDLRITESNVEIYSGSTRLTTHPKFPEYVHNQYSTHPEDMPPAFRDIEPWDDKRIRRWAKSIGPNTYTVIDRIFSHVRIKEQGYNSCLAVLKLSSTYTDGRLETACEIALNQKIAVPRYHHLKAILSSNQDIAYLEEKNSLPFTEDTSMGYLRGDDYYRRGGDGHA